MMTLYTEDEVFQLAVAYLQDKYPKASLGARAYLGQQARALAELIGLLQQGIREADNDGCPAYQIDYDGIIRSRCSSEALDNWAFVFGVPSNRGPGIYGRNAAQAARGGAGIAVGTPALVIPAGSTLADDSGSVTVALVSAVTLDGSGHGSCQFVAQTTGVAGNLPVGARLTWQSPVAGLAPTLVLTAALVNGYDVESDLDLLLRIIQRLQNPPKGGTASDWREWAETATDSAGRLVGIDRDYVFPLRNGGGSVDNVITQAGDGTGRDPGATKAALVAAFLETKRIVTDSYRVIRPSFAPAFRLLLRVVSSAGYGYDWDDLFVPMVVVSNSANFLVVSGALPPANLKAAVDLGSQPRIQLAGFSSTPLPEQRRVTGYAANTPTAGQCRLTLDSGFDVPALAGELVYAGGGAVDIVALFVLNYVNHVGPSRQSGYAASGDVWESVVSVSRVAQSAIDSRDVYGQHPIIYDPRVGEGVGVVFTDVATGVSDSKDRRLWDNLPATVGPQLPVCTGILVVKG